MQLVIVESPYAGDVARNERYARACLRDCLQRGEAPFASHLLYPQVLDDDKPGDRTLGMDAGWAWMGEADAVVVYTDFGISGGMEAGIRRAQEAEIPVYYRELPPAVLMELDG